MMDQPTVSWRRLGAIAFTFALGFVAGGGAAWNDQPPEQRSPPAAAEPSVRLVLSAVASGTTDAGSLWIDGALLHHRGTGTATVTRIHRPGGGLTIQVPALPVRLSVNHSFEPIRLEIAPRDCVLAAQWTPSAQPFTLTWQDQHGEVRTDVGGDHDASMELSLVRHIAAVCGDPRAP